MSCHGFFVFDKSKSFPHPHPRDKLTSTRMMLIFTAKLTPCVRVCITWSVSAMPATAVMAHCQSPSPGVTFGNHFLGKNLKNGYFEKSSENKKHKKMSAIFYPVSSEFHHNSYSCHSRSRSQLKAL